MTRARRNYSLEMGAPIAATIVLSAAFMTTAAAARIFAPAVPAAPRRPSA